MHYCTAQSTWTLLLFIVWCWGKQLHWQRMGWTFCKTQLGPGNATVPHCLWAAPKIVWWQPFLAMAAHHQFLKDNLNSRLYFWKIHICCISSSSPCPVAIWTLPQDALNDFPTSWRRPWCHQGNSGWTLSTVEEPSLGHTRMPTDQYWYQKAVSGKSISPYHLQTLSFLLPLCWV